MSEAGLFELSFEYRFEAAHRFTKSCADSCATPHGHTWYAKAFFEAAAATMGADDMVLEFAQLKKAWKSFLQETVDHSFMHHHADPILPALREHIAQFRGLPFPGDPTTELIAVLFLAKLQSMHRALGEKGDKIKPSAVLIKETPTNSILFKADYPVGAPGSMISALDSRFDGWWQTADASARHLTIRA